MSGAWQGGKGDANSRVDFKKYQSAKFWDRKKIKTGGYNLFLDDFRFPKDAYCSLTGSSIVKITGISETGWEIVRNFDEFVEKIESEGVPNIISFDHDLCPKATGMAIEYIHRKTPFDYTQCEKTGAHAAQFLVDLCEKNGIIMPDHFIHSANPFGVNKIIKILEKTERI